MIDQQTRETMISLLGALLDFGSFDHAAAAFRAHGFDIPPDKESDFNRQLVRLVHLATYGASGQDIGPAVPPGYVTDQITAMIARYRREAQKGAESTQACEEEDAQP